MSILSKVWGLINFAGEFHFLFVNYWPSNDFAVQLQDNAVLNSFFFVPAQVYIGKLIW